MSKNIKIVAIADIHGCIEQINIPECDILIIAGDLGKYGRDYFRDFGWVTNFFIPWLIRQPASSKIIVPGNHDIVFERIPSIIDDIPANVLIDSYVNVDGLNIYGSPYSLEFLNWGFGLPENKLKQVWDMIPDINIDILVTHSPPYGILDSTKETQYYASKKIGSPSLLNKILDIKPKYCIFGHNHDGSGELIKNDINFINASLLDSSGSGRIKFPPRIFNVNVK